MNGGVKVKVHHIGYAVKNIDKSFQMFEKMGFHKIGNETHDMIRKVDICFIADEGEKTIIELIAPFEKGSDVDGALEKWGGPNPYHICYEVDNIEDSIQELERCIVVKKPEVAPAINNRRVAFLYNNNLGLFELVEK